MEKDIILINGAPGSGKSRLSRSSVDELWTELSIEHISTGDRIRKIGRGAIESYWAQEIREHLNGPSSQQLLPNEVISTVIEEALNDHHTTEHLLLDGTPRTIDQFHDLTEVAKLSGRKISGALVVTTDDDTAVSRMIMRRPREYEGKTTVSQARDRISLHHDNYTPVLEEFIKIGLPVRIIDSSGIKADTNEAGIKALRDIFGMTSTDENHAA